MSTPPDAPPALWVADMRPTGARRCVVLCWPSVPGAVAYQVRVAGGDGVILPAVPDANMGCAVYVTPGTWLVAQVAAVDDAGLVSEFSPLVEVTVD